MFVPLLNNKKVCTKQFLHRSAVDEIEEMRRKSAMVTVETSCNKK